jgi:hypothetical protein
MHDCGGHLEPGSPWLLDAYSGHLGLVAAAHQQRQRGFRRGGDRNARRRGSEREESAR